MSDVLVACGVEGRTATVATLDGVGSSMAVVMAADGDPVAIRLAGVFDALIVASVTLLVRRLALTKGSGDDRVDATEYRTVRVR